MNTSKKSTKTKFSDLIGPTVSFLFVCYPLLSAAFISIWYKDFSENNPIALFLISSAPILIAIIVYIFLRIKYKVHRKKLDRHHKTTKKIIADFNTYHPDELFKYLTNLHLLGHTIIDIKTPSVIYSHQKGKYVALDKPFVLVLDDGRMIGIGFDAASHPSITIFDNPNRLKTTKEQKKLNRNYTVADILDDVIGKKISQFTIYTSKNIDMISDAYHDEGLDENQTEFICSIVLFFNDQSTLYLHPIEDYTTVFYQQYKIDK